MRQCAKQTIQRNRPQTAIQYDTEMKRYACWITEATDTHTDYVIIVDFSHQQLLSGPPSVITYSAVRVLFSNMLTQQVKSPNFTVHT